MDFDYHKLEILIVIAFFAIVFFVMLWLIGMMSGWPELAQKYRATTRVDGKSWRWRNVVMGLRVQFGGVTFTANNQGLGVRPFWLFRLGCHPLFIPWEEVTIEPTRLYFVLNKMGLHFSRAPHVPIFISISLGSEISRFKNGSHGNPPIYAA